jgi:hypothetical protein
MRFSHKYRKIYLRQSILVTQSHSVSKWQIFQITTYKESFLILLAFFQIAGEQTCSVIFASSQVAGAPPPSLPSPEHGSPPTEREALEREKMLTAQYPLFDKASGREYDSVRYPLKRARKGDSYESYGQKTMLNLAKFEFSGYKSHETVPLGEEDSAHAAHRGGGEDQSQQIK